ncbi:MAG TPA: sugar transferase [Chloroflexi bacterium]|nr:sugar transferase [Chloroflexota bacterium]
MLKRGFDLVVGTAILILCLPLFPIIALAIRLDSPGPVFHRAIRVGREGREFKLYKFRTMVADAERKGPGITVAGDPRVTRVGQVLRRTKLDELPQLINVLRGEMSLVGPRPEDPRYVALYTPEQRAVLNVRPGMTGLAAVRYHNEETLLEGPDWEKTYIEKIMPAKLALELEYVRNPTLWRDLGILFQTALVLFRLK